MVRREERAMPTPLRVLIVEDRSSDIELMLAELRQAGFDPRWEVVESEADYLARLDPALDLILADCRLPRFDARRALRGVRERGLTIPFIIVTGAAGEAEALECMKQGAADYLLRDRLRRLGPAARRALEERQARIEHGKAEAALQEGEERFRLLLETLTDAVIIVDAQGRIVFANPAAEQIFGHAIGEMLGQPLVMLMPERLRQRHLASFHDYLARRERHIGWDRIELPGRHRTGAEIPLEISFREFRYRGATMFTGTVRDIGDRKRAEETAERHRQAAQEQAEMLERRVAGRTEELVRASQHKSQFLANMSHELRTPLHSILGFAEVLLGGRFGPLAERHREFVGEIQDSATHLLGLINEVLDLAKVEAGRVGLSREFFSLTGALAGVEGAVAVLAQRQGISLTRSVEAGLSLVWADPTRFRQILYNLLSNAIKFTPEGGKVTVTARKRAAISDCRLPIADLRTEPESPVPIAPSTEHLALSTEEWIEISVSDTGIGIAPEDQARIFEAFEQLKTPGLPKPEGTGLGLALTRRLVELHGGRIGVESAGRGLGATFTFTLPWRSPASQRRILIVEDEPNLRDLLREHLVAQGYVVGEAEGGGEALAAAAAQPPDLVILDVGLPDMDGRQVLAGLRENPATARIPVVILTGLAGVRAEDLLAEGASEFLTKPFSLSVLSQVVDRFLEPS
jgi:PAS domain S-box-containing protein